jgi:hypothetical protein
MKRKVKSFLQLAKAGLFVLGLCAGVAGQSVRDVERAENDRDLELRSWNLKVLQLQHDKERNGRPRVQQALAQLQEDFSRLQVANRNLLRTALSKNMLDPRFVSKSVLEIKKRAERLNLNLALPEPERQAQVSEADAASTPGQLRASVLKLGRLIFSFVDNPFFREESVVDTQLTTKARRDLEDIIELSKQIKKSSDRFGKDAP